MKANTPKLRFKEFTEEWQFKPLDNLAKTGTGNHDTQDRIDSGKYPFFVRSDNVERINSYSYDGIAILTSGDGVGVGKNFHYIDGKFDYHQRVYAIKEFNSLINSRFLYQYFADRFYNRVMRMSAKNSVDSIRMDMIAKMPIPVPTIQEQEKIAGFLTVVDEKIKKIEEKKKGFEKYKKGVMKSIFSQKTRFKKPDGSNFPDWGEKKLCEVADRVVQKNKENILNVLTISAQQGLVNQQNYFNRPVSALDVTGYYLLQNGDFAYNKSYSTGYPMGAIKRLSRYEKGVVSTLYICFRVKHSEISSFFEQLFETGLQNHEITKVAQEGARNHGLLNIGVDDFFSIRLNVPGREEQEKIAEFLTILDNKIDLINKQLEKTKLFKKSLLQQMFV